jgi:hypothetical protein
MTVNASDLGTLGNLGKALGFLDPGSGQPVTGWLGDPAGHASRVLGDPGQRDALLAFVDDTLGGGERTTDERGVVWLPIVSVGPDRLDHLDSLDLSITIEGPGGTVGPDVVVIGIGLSFTTANPTSRTTVSVPLFQTSTAVTTPAGFSTLRLGTPGGRLRVATDITFSDEGPEPGQANLGGLVLEADLPTTVGDVPASFGLTLRDLQLPGSATVSDLRVASDALDDLEDTVLQTALGLVQDHAATAQAAGSDPALVSVAGLLGFLDGDGITALPIDDLVDIGVAAVADWLAGVMTDPASRDGWLTHLADLLGGRSVAGAVELDVGPATVTVGLEVVTGSSGHVELVPTLTARIGGSDRRAEVVASLCRIDLTTGDGVALPSLGMWIAAGDAGSGAPPVLAEAGPPAVTIQALRLGFEVDDTRRLRAVVAADGVDIDDTTWPVLDLTSAGALMDVADRALDQLADELLAGLGDSLATIEILLGLSPPPGHPDVPVVSPIDLLTGPLDAVVAHWRNLAADHCAAIPAILEVIRDAVADGAVVAGNVTGHGEPDDPWRMPLVGPVTLDVVCGDPADPDRPVLTVALAASTRVDSLGERCTVLETTLAATVAVIDLDRPSVTLVPGVEARILARERGVSPPRITLPLGVDAELAADHAGLVLTWSVDGGLGFAVVASGLTLETAAGSTPILLPTVAGDGTVDLDADGWAALQELIVAGQGAVGGFLGAVLDLLGWRAGRSPVLSLPDLVTDPMAAIAAWAPQLILERGATAVMGLLADLLAAVGPVGVVPLGTGHPDDPYRIDLGPGVPQPALWFPPSGLEPRGTAVPASVQAWRPGRPGLSSDDLEDALEGEATLDPEVADLVRGRALASGLDALVERWTGSDGRIAPPATPPDGIEVVTAWAAAGQLLGELVLETELGRVPTTTVHIAVGAGSWPDAPPDRLIDLTAPGLDPAMFSAPAPAPGSWFVALGGRAACQLTDELGQPLATDPDGTRGQAERLAVVLEPLVDQGDDPVAVAVAGAGHAARLALAADGRVTDLFLVGTPLAPISLTAATDQPTADALRLLDALLVPAPAEPSDEDDDLRRGRGLVRALRDLPLPDPGVELRRPVETSMIPGPIEGGPTIRALLGELERDQIERAVTAIVAAGLSARARARAAAGLDPFERVEAGLHLPIDAGFGGTLRVDGQAQLRLATLDLDGELNPACQVRARLWLTDRQGWLAATPDLDLRMVSFDVTFSPDGSSPGRAEVRLHDARVGDLRWERLVIGADDPALPLLPEARQLLDTAAQRLAAEAEAGATGNSTARAAHDLAVALGLFDAGGAMHDAVDQLVHDPDGLLGHAHRTAGPALAAAVADLLGPMAAVFDVESGTVDLAAGDPSLGLFGWRADIHLSLTDLSAPGAVDGTITFGPEATGVDPDDPGGHLQLAVDLAPLSADLRWHRPGGEPITETIELWPEPDAGTLARTVAEMVPGEAARNLLELVRATDPAVRPIIDAAIDSVGLLTAAVGDADRQVRSLTGLVADPARWMRHPAAVGSQVVRAQAVIDAIRPLLGLAGVPGDPLVFGAGVSVAVAGDGTGLRLDVTADSSAFTTPTGATSRLRSILDLAVIVDPAGPATMELAASVGVADDSLPPDRQAAHLGLDRAGALSLLLRPRTGPDITLLPFGGYASLAGGAVGAALPFVLDRLAALPNDVGTAVAATGDALALRTGTPPDRSFDGDALTLWANEPVAALGNAALSLSATLLGELASALDALVVGLEVDHEPATGELTVTAGPVSLRWSPTAGRVTLAVEELTVADTAAAFTLTTAAELVVSSAGLDRVCATIGPATVDIGDLVLRPFAVISAGASPPGGAGVEIGLAVDDSGRRFGGRWLFGQSFDLVAGPDLACGLDHDTDLATIAERALLILLDLGATMALSTESVQDLLDIPVDLGSGPTGAVRDLLADVLLTGDGLHLLPGAFDPTTALDRAVQLVADIGGLSPTVEVAGTGFTVSLLTTDDEVVGLRVDLTDQIELLSGETMLWLETDASWIGTTPSEDSGVFVGLLDVSGQDPVVAPSLAINGVGIRLGALSGPLVDLGLTLGSLAVHTFAEIDGRGLVGGGMQVQFAELAVDAAGAAGGNPIAQGILADTGSQPPSPAFSPALAVQWSSGQATSVALRAGDGAGPWWVGIQKSFGPLYVEQIGFGVAPPQGDIDQISLFFDGSVSMFGLQCTVDDLEITFASRVGDQDNDLFDPGAWQIDLAGLAVAADLGGITVSGGLLKSGQGSDIEYLGMLMARFGVYGLTIYGGYGESAVTVDGVATQERFVSFFAVGAIVGPIGGIPAFFLTGIGGGFGINRALEIPADLSTFGDYPLIKALDTAAEVGNPMEELRSLATYFPPQQDTFWFAAGISFTSFAIVNGIAVVAVEIGDGLDINLIGEAQLALPRPEVALVSIELALLVRFSSSEGVIWVQGQLTDNSWLLYRDVKLTGGFAYVLWFSGANRGQFVITMGGYHPDFERPDYPVVPRLGIDWKVSRNIHISAGGYFALTSEAVMAGGDFEASAEFGSAWAEVGFGAHAIVYFDPFHYQASAYARIAAGVTVDLWVFGEGTISISRGASIEVEGPDFRGSVTFEVGPVELTVGFGSSKDNVDELLDDRAFADKYLDGAGTGRAVALAAVTSSGAAPPVTGAPTPDGKPDRPFIVTPEFGMIVTSVVPLEQIDPDGPQAPSTTSHPATLALGLAPMGETSISPTLRLSWTKGDQTPDFPFEISTRPYGAFPLGIWGPAREEDHKALPKGEVVEALNEIELVASAELSDDDANPEIAYHRVEIGDRLPLPFTRRPAVERAIVAAGQAITGLVDAPTDADSSYAGAATWLAATASPTALAALEGERQAPPLLGTLGEALDGQAVTAASDLADPIPPRIVDRTVHAPRAIALLPAVGPNEIGDPSRAGARRRTTVTLDRGARPWRRRPPTIAAVEAGRSRSVATGLVVVEPAATVVAQPAAPPAAAAGRGASGRAGVPDDPRRPTTVIATGDVPPSGSGRARPALVRRRGGDGTTSLDRFTAALRAGRRQGQGRPGAELGPGDIVVLQLPNARRDNDPSGARPGLAIGGDGGPVRLVALDNSGRVIVDRVEEVEWTVPRGTERVVVVGQGRPDRERPVSAAGLLGWHAGLQLAYLGRSRAVGPGCVVTTRGGRIRRHRQRAGAGWILGSELAAGGTTVTTRFARPVRSVVLVFDDPETSGALVDGRELRLGLIGATRTIDDGRPRPPVVLSSENRSFLAYDIEPDRIAGGGEGGGGGGGGGRGPVPVEVTVVSQPGWSVVGVLAGTDLDAKASMALLAARGLDASTIPMATGGRGVARLRWVKADEAPGAASTNEES